MYIKACWDPKVFIWRVMVGRLPPEINNQQWFGLRWSKPNRLKILKPEPNQTVKPLKLRFSGSASIFKLGQNSNLKY